MNSFPFVDLTQKSQTPPHRCGARLVLFFTGQYTFPFVNWAVGQPMSPAFVPFGLVPDLKPPFSFRQRVTNVIVFGAWELMRLFYVAPKVEAVIDKHFPEDAESWRPPVLELERDASLVLDMGHQVRRR